MSLVGKLMGFGLRQVIGDVAGNATETVVNLVVKRFADHSQTLPKALARANDRSWQALGIALAGDGLLDQIKVFFASGDDKGIREQVRLFLQHNQITFHDSSAHFRAKCLAELKKAKEAGVLKLAMHSVKDIAHQTASFQRYADPTGMIDGAEQVVRQIADELAPHCPNLAKLLCQQPSGSPPLLVSAFAYFFRREVETNQELAHGLQFDGLRQLSASQDKAFTEVGKALDSLGDQFEQLFEQLDRIETVVVETHGAVLDLQSELTRIGEMNLSNRDEVRRLLDEVLSRVSQLGMQKGEVKPQHSFSIRSEDERIAVKNLLARFRQIPSNQQHRLPALLNGLGKLQIGSGDYEGAKQTFIAVSEEVTDAKAQAEAHFNAYRAALEEKKWDEALVEVQKATALDSDRFSPFPMKRYHPKRILGAGGFGTAFLCDDRNFEEQVVVKTLHAGDLERSTFDVFREARLLRKLSHPAIIGVHECEYADPVKQARPFIVMDYFAGGSLESFVERQGVISANDMIAIAIQIADGLHAAHHQDILHRDIKPDNILVWKDNSTWKVKIIDFGLALRQQAIETSKAAGAAGNTVLGESVAGTIKYAPPEQLGELKGIKTGKYSDVYAFGKMCCQALFNTTEPKRRHWSLVPPALHEMLEQCTERELTHRWSNFEPVLKALKTLASGDPGRKQEDKKPGCETKESKIAVVREVASKFSSEYPGWASVSEMTDDEINEMVRQKHGFRGSVQAVATKLGLELPDLKKVIPDNKKPEVVVPTPETALRAAHRQGHVLVTSQKDGEANLAKLVRDALERTQGKPTKDDSAAANEILKRFQVPSDRAKQIVHEVRTQWADNRSRKNAGIAGDIITNSVGMKLAWIPPGTFVMGSPADEEGRKSGESQHQVMLTRGYFLAIHPVTQACWREVTGSSPSHSKGDDLPVEGVSWEDCQEFLSRLSKRDGHPYRLPTEAEWEYACRAGTTTPYSCGATITAAQANFKIGGPAKPTPVGSFAANSWGFYDMHGNVHEWCADWYKEYAATDAVNPTGPEGGKCRVLRGGSFTNQASYLRSAHRSYDEPSVRGSDFGFRPARTCPLNISQEVNVATNELAKNQHQAELIVEEKNDGARSGRWTEADFLERVRTTMPESLAVHVALLEKLKAARMVDFCGNGKKNATYHVVLPGTKTNIAWVYDDGRIYIRWGTLKNDSHQYRDMWGQLVDSKKPDGCDLIGGLFGAGNFDVFVRNMNRIKDVIRTTP
jgi:formylglycine-generating enzyme required for sulfatase activity/tetratricopeptide (TPR) repeat protein